VKKDEKEKSKNTLLSNIIITYKKEGIIRIPESTEIIEIAHEFLGTALNGDMVRILLHPKKHGLNQTGEVIEIISRVKVGHAGVLEEENGIFYLHPSDNRTYVDIVIPKDKLNGAKTGQKVFGVITDWKNNERPPIGEIKKVLGKPFENEAEMQAIALEKGFDSNFPKEVTDEAKRVANINLSKEEISKRKDLRKTTTVTIDPVDAKDFDDAISFTTLPSGKFEVGVHIADVSHFVTKGGPLDKEARERGTSVYLVDRTIPMLPEELSNDICSLKPGEDRLAFSAIFEMDKEGNVSNRWFGKTIIHSDKRFTYEEAEVVIKEKSGPYSHELVTLNQIAKKLHKRRFEKGAISLEHDEVRFILDENGKPVSVYVKERGDSNKMIEELMLLANREVAEYISKKRGKEEGVFLYRIHDLPNKEKVQDLVSFLKKLGYKVNLKNGIITSEEINRIVDSLENSPIRDTISTAIIRTMSKAIYSTNNIGHFGLGFKHYTHFTSPIRRYPDVVVHRLLLDALEKRSIPKEKWQEYEKISIQSSLREKEASEAERNSIKYKQVEYMSSRIGQKFEGTITSVTEWGLYVEEKDSRCEGMIPIRDLGSDFFMFDKKGMSIVGKRTHKKYTLGDKIKFSVKNTDQNRKTIDYQLI
jgi:ribonuclease R